MKSQPRAPQFFGFLVPLDSWNDSKISRVFMTSLPINVASKVTQQIHMFVAYRIRLEPVQRMFVSPCSSQRFWFCNTRKSLKLTVRFWSVIYFPFYFQGDLYRYVRYNLIVSPETNTRILMHPVTKIWNTILENTGSYSWIFTFALVNQVCGVGNQRKDVRIELFLH